jgi:hypothetical protein
MPSGLMLPSIHDGKRRHGRRYATPTAVNRCGVWCVDEKAGRVGSKLLPLREMWIGHGIGRYGHHVCASMSVTCEGRGLAVAASPSWRRKTESDGSAFAPAGRASACEKACPDLN